MYHNYRVHAVCMRTTCIPLLVPNMTITCATRITHVTCMDVIHRTLKLHACSLTHVIVCSACYMHTFLHRGTMPFLRCSIASSGCTFLNSITISRMLLLQVYVPRGLTAAIPTTGISLTGIIALLVLRSGQIIR